MLSGSCLCGGVRFEIDGKLGPASHCHCTMCRKAHGAAFGTYAAARASELKVVAGADLIVRYVSSPGIVRAFCSRCGSRLQWLRESKPEVIDIALGAIDGDPGVRPSFHIHVASRAPWHDISDALPQHAAGVPPG